MIKKLRNEDELVSKKLALYSDFLKGENEKYNLTSITNDEDIYIKHFLDSVALLDVVDLKNKSLCDIGSGAGFPGIVLKIYEETLQVTIIEATRKKVEFLENLVKLLELDGVRIIHGRAEEVVTEFYESFDYVTARAVADLPILLELTAPFVKVGQGIIAYKGDSYISELERSRRALKELHLELDKSYPYTLPNNKGNRALLVFKKLTPTDRKYPRPYREIKKKPL